MHSTVLVIEIGPIHLGAERESEPIVSWFWIVMKQPTKILAGKKNWSHMV